MVFLKGFLQQQFDLVFVVVREELQLENSTYFLSLLSLSCLLPVNSAYMSGPVRHGVKLRKNRIWI